MAEHPTDLPMTVDHHAPCQGCAYDLMGLPLDGVCPECAVPVRRSVHGDLLRFADPRWSSRVHRGLRVVFRTVVWLLVAVILMILVLMFEDVTATSGAGAAGAVGAGSAGVGVTMVLSRSLFLLVMIAGAVAYATGWWRASTADPAPGDDHAAKNTLLRMTGVLAPFAMAGWIAVAGGGSARIFPAIPVALCALAAMAPIATHLVLSVRLVQRLTRRCGALSADAQVDTFRRLRRTLVLVLLLSGMAVVILLHSLVRSMGAVSASSGSAGAAVGAAWVVMGVVWMMVAGEFETLNRRMKKECALRPGG